MGTTIDVRDLMTTAMTAGATEDEATEIAIQLDKRDTVTGEFHADGRIDYVVTQSDEEYVCKVIRETVKAGPPTEIQTAVFKLLDPRSLPLPGTEQVVLTRVPDEEEPVVYQADAFSDIVVLLAEFAHIAKNAPIDPDTASKMQRLVSDMQVQIKEAGPENFLKFTGDAVPQGYRKGMLNAFAQLKTSVGLVFRGRQSILNEGLTEKTSADLKTAMKALEDFSRFRDGSLRLAAFAKNAQGAASNGRVVATTIQQAATAAPSMTRPVQGARFVTMIMNRVPEIQQAETQIVQRASVAPNPALKGALLVAAAAVVVVGAGAGLYYYFSGNEAEAATVPPVPRQDAGVPASPKKEESRTEWGIPVEQLEDATVDVESLPSVPAPRAKKSLKSR